MKKTGYYKIVGIVFAIIIIIGAGFSFYAKSTSTVSKEKSVILLKATDNQPEDYPTTKGLRYMAKLLEERSNGHIKMTVYSSAILGDGKDILDATQVGTLDIGRISVSSLVGYSPELNVFMTPFLFRDADHEWKVLDGPIGEKLLKGLEKNGFVGLGYYDAGARSFYSKKPIQSPQDLLGQKTRVLDVKIQKEMIVSMGGEPLTTPFLDVYPGFQTGALDAAENSPPSFYSTKHYELAKYFTITEHVSVPETIIISKKTWDTLSPQDQELIQQATKDSTVYQKQLWSEFSKQSMEKLKEQGVNVIIPNKELFQQAVAPLYAKYPEYKDLIKEIQDTK
ncbi:TRAP transporter substrate-binding protein [Pelosinus sp. UFO1]|uniref:TRAP transporter substrate-binding protein n=1 Tax=Pelosinus sp. UFO1 TaxID=484770 RepID=UPI0004D1C3EF|nr:TRAP transporter substrate-binding protein [Pelosinus sp. UFO1]AIF52346.1 TRAP dicarboxylate transporter, DctP subunit [Pelosinus sp. UFO1]